MTDLKLSPEAIEVLNKLEGYFHEPVEVREDSDPDSNKNQESLILAVQTRRSVQEALELFDKFLNDFWLTKAEQEGYTKILPTLEFPK